MTTYNLLAVITIILDSMFDRIETCLPPCSPVETEVGNLRELQGYVRGAMETAGMFLATLYAKETNDGLAISDALAIGIEDAVNAFMAARMKDPLVATPSTSELACRFLKETGLMR